MRFVPVWTMLPLILLAACQSAPQSGGSLHSGRPCSPRLADAGQCNPSSIYVFPELTNIR
jgi:hypothetical protein